MIRYEVADEGITEVVAATEAAFTALAKHGPEGVRFTYGRRAGSNEFTALLELDDGVNNPLLDIEEAQALQATIAKWAKGAPPIPQPFQLIGSYGIMR
jgi:hypothetical protein